MTIYSSTTLAELLDALDMRVPDLAAPIRERVAELEGDLEDMKDRVAEMEVRNEALESRIEELEDES